MICQNLFVAIGLPRTARLWAIVCTHALALRLIPTLRWDFNPFTHGYTLAMIQSEKASNLLDRMTVKGLNEAISLGGILDDVTRGPESSKATPPNRGTRWRKGTHPSLVPGTVGYLGIGLNGATRALYGLPVAFAAQAEWQSRPGCARWFCGSFLVAFRLCYVKMTRGIR